MAHLYFITIFISVHLQNMEIFKVSADLFRNECSRKGVFSNKRTDYSLQNHIIETVQVGHVTECTIACLEHSSCKSYNFQESLKNCEISSSTKSLSSADFVSRSGYSYYDTGDTTQPGPNCQSSPCVNGATCVDTCTPQGYYCLCPAGSVYGTVSGSQCQIPAPFPDSCKKVKKLGLNSDGEYNLYLQLPSCSIPALVYCADMNKDNPIEYITLPAGRSVNYAFDNPSGNPRPHEGGKTAYDKIRIKLPEREVVRDDYRFAVLVSGFEKKSYGSASSCWFSCCDASCKVGHTKADLTGTNFKFPPTIPYDYHSWPHCGSFPVNPSMSSDQKRWSVTCGGYCGGCQPEVMILSVDGC